MPPGRTRRKAGRGPGGRWKRQDGISAGRSRRDLCEGGAPACALGDQEQRPAVSTRAAHRQPCTAGDAEGGQHAGSGDYSINPPILSRDMTKSASKPTRGPAALTAIYCRISRDRQDEAGVNRQEDLCRARCKREGWALIAEPVVVN